MKIAHQLVPDVQTGTIPLSLQAAPRSVSVLSIQSPRGVPTPQVLTAIITETRPDGVDYALSGTPSEFGYTLNVEIETP